MNNHINERQKSVLSYVINRTTLFNTFFLLLHLAFGFFFKHYDIKIMFYYNLLSIVTYLTGYVILYKNLSNLYIAINNLEVYFFTILAILCLGWDYGFQQYCFIFIASLLFSDYFTTKDRKVNKVSVFLIGVTYFTYLFWRIWTYSFAPIYTISTETPMHLLFLVNSIIAFTFLIAYAAIYSGTVFRLEKALVEAANNDPLTGLRNRRRMMKLLNSISQDPSATNVPMCIAMMDIDNFKKINDTYGHDAGDEVIKSLASTLLQKHAKIESFHACRWGGEEFLIFYRKYRKNEEQIFLEFDEIRKQIEQQTIRYNNQEIHFTVTIGLAFYRKNLSADALIQLADENLYKGKTSGKNVVIY